MSIASDTDGAEARGRGVLGQRTRTPAWRRVLDRWAAWIAILPALALVLFFIYGGVVWTIYMSTSASTLMPVYRFEGLEPYTKMWMDPRWLLALWNLLVFSLFYVGLTLAVGLFLAILMDQHIRGEAIFRSLFLYPMAISFVVTGAIWKWIYHPSTGVQSYVRSLGWEGFQFDWITDPDRALYVVILTGVWQSSGFAMILFLAGLRAVDQSVIKAARVDGAGPVTIYSRIVVPMIAPITIAVTVLLTQFAIKTFELVLAMTDGGPGVATTMPTIYIFEVFYTRGQIARGAAAAVTLMVLLALVALPAQWVRMRRARAAAADRKASERED